jgi:hypothetical protein
MTCAPVPTRGGSAAIVLVAATLSGCGSNEAGIPPALYDAIQNRKSDAAYPAGPYGTEVGSTAPDLCFEGWKDPAGAGYDPARLSPLCFSDFYDPTGASSKLLLVNSSALWCTACRYEYGGSGDRPSLSERLAERKARGFEILGTLFQNEKAAPASGAEAAAWAETYGVAFPFALDESHALGVFASPTIAPFNLLLDTRTMHVVLALEGDEPAVLFGAVDDFLAKGAP